MKIKGITTLACAAVLVTGASLTAQAFAQENYPTRPINIIVPFGPGGSADIYARFLAEKMQQKLGQTVVIENKPGAGAVIGTSYVARANPDGYTLLVISNTHTTNETIIKDKPYKLLEDFVPVAPINEANLVLVANPGLKATTVKEIIALEKAKPGSLNYASSGVGTPYHLAGEYFKSMAGIKAQHVPYKSSGQARTGVVGGEVDYMFDAIATMQTFAAAGKVRAIATTGTKRSDIFPNVPTVAEAGLPGYSANIWLGLVAPKGTPDSVVQKLNKTISDIEATDEVRKAWAKDGVTPMIMNTTDFGTYIKDDVKRLGKIATDAGMVQ
jgi:tripartite-type tricarboxylate transporter receptor subunit TctC